MTRLCACGVLIRNDSLLMVLHVEPDKSYWTLPGGAIEAGETAEQAAVREIFEETGVRVRIVRLLCELSYKHREELDNPEYVYLVEAVACDAIESLTVGCDPEEAHLPRSGQILQDVGWRPLSLMKDDVQVSAVLRALGADFKLHETK